MSGIVAPFLFLGFLLAALVLLPDWSGLARVPRRFRVSLFLLYTLGASGLAGFGQKDMYPFASWPLIAGTVLPYYTHPRLMLVDDRGIEYEVDYRAFEPLGFREVRTWFERVAIYFPPADQDVIARRLVDMANAARQRVLDGGTPGTLDRFLGPLTAPEFLLHPHRWVDRASVPPRPFTGLRLYRDTWSLEARGRGIGTVHSFLVFAWSEPGRQ